MTPTAAPAERVQATPVVRRIAQELGVDLAAVTGTGPGGRVTEDDVRAAAGGGEGRREPLRGVRRVIAEHMTRAHREVPPVTWVEECDFEDVPLDRLLPIVVKACAETLVRVPRAQRAARRGRDRLPRPLRHRRRGADRGRARRPGRARREREDHRRARCRDRGARRARPRGRRWAPTSFATRRSR